MTFRNLGDEPEPDPTVPTADADEIEYVKTLHDAGAIRLGAVDADGVTHWEGWCGPGDAPTVRAYWAD